MVSKLYRAPSLDLPPVYATGANPTIAEFLAGGESSAPSPQSAIEHQKSKMADIVASVYVWGDDETNSAENARGFEHDPEKHAAGLDAVVGTGFRTRSCANQKA